MAGKKEYLVYGATLKCSMGCKYKKLELPKDHGVYTKNLPMVHERDRTLENIPLGSFGICNGECTAAEKLYTLEEDGEYGKKGEEMIGPACEPKIMENWKEAHEKVFIYDGGNRKALTTDSILICAYGGEIEVVTSGQENG